MTFIDRYQNGETKSVYEDIYALGDTALHIDHFSDVDQVLQETCKRLRYNLEIIYRELRKLKYGFTKDIRFDWQQPMLPPDPNTDIMLAQLPVSSMENRFPFH